MLYAWRPCMDSCECCQVRWHEPGGWVVIKGFWAGRTASCREALGRQRNASLWQSCVLKRGCVLLCFSCLSKPNFVELGKAVGYETGACCLHVWSHRLWWSLPCMLHWRSERKGGLRKRLPCMKLQSHVWHEVGRNPHLTTPTQHVMVGITRSKVFFLSTHAKIHAQVQIGSFPHQGKKSKHKLRSYHLVVCFFFHLLV